MAIPIRMKKKTMNKLAMPWAPKAAADTLLKATVEASSDAASTGNAAQPELASKPEEATGLPGGKSVSMPASTAELGTMEAPERVAPETVEAVIATNHGAMKPSELVEEAEKATTTALATEAPSATADDTQASGGLGGAKAEITQALTASPDQEKAATTISPNLGEAKVVGKTESADADLKL